MENVNILKVLRTDRANTQQEIADILGCSRISYIYYENGSRSISLKGLAKLMKYYGVSADFLLGRSPYKRIPMRGEEFITENDPEASEKKISSPSDTAARTLKQLRKSRLITQQQVADFLGCTQAGYCCYESGKREISSETAAMLCTYFNVSVDYLLGFTRKIKYEE